MMRDGKANPMRMYNKIFLVMMAAVLSGCSLFSSSVQTAIPPESNNRPTSTPSGTAQTVISQDGFQVADGQVMFDYGDITITSLQYGYSPTDGVGFYYSIHNDSDQEFLLSSDCITVNGYSYYNPPDDTFQYSVKPHSDDRNKLILDTDLLSAFGIHEICSIGGQFTIYDPDTQAVLYIGDPFLVKTDHFDDMQQSDLSSFELVYEDDKVRISIKPSKTFFTEGIPIIIKNKTDMTLLFSPIQMQVNDADVLVTGGLTEVPPGGQGISLVKPYRDSLAEEDIGNYEDLQKVALSFGASQPNSQNMELTTPQFEILFYQQDYN